MGLPAGIARAGTRNGAVRNQLMIALALPQLVIAFPDGLGTADMVERARGAGIEVIELDLAA